MWRRSRQAFVIAGSVALSPGAAVANVPMFLVIAFTRITFWWTIPVAIALEAVAIALIFGVRWKQAAVLSTAVNGISAAAGFFVYPLVGMSLYPALYPAVTSIFGFGLIVEAAATFMALAVVDTAIELVALGVFLRRAGLREGALFLAVNVVTAGILLGAVLYANAPPRMTDVERDAFLSEFSREMVLISEVLDEAPEHLGLTEFGFSEDWLADKATLAEGLDFTMLRVGTRRRMGHVVSTPDLGMHGATLEAESREDGLIIQRLARDPRDGGGHFWSVTVVRDVGETRYSVNARME